MGWQDGSVVGDVGNLQRFLDFLGKSEGADYGTIVGGGKFEDFSKHPGVVGLRTKEGPSTAAGRYQITQTTYNDVAPKLGIKDFSPESQDAIATELIRRRGAFDAVVAGDYKTAVAKLGSEWASLPSSPYSQPKKDWAFVEKNLTQEKTPAWMSDPVVEEGGPQQSAQPAWMSDPVVDDEVPPEAPKAPQATTPAPTPQKAPVEVPRASPGAAPAKSFAENATHGLSFGTRDVLEGVEKAFTYPVRAVGEFASGALRLAGQREMADKVSQTIGMQNRGAGAVVADATGLDKAETKTEKTASAFTQAASGLVPGTALARLTQKAPEAVRSAASILTPSTGGSAANVTKDAAVFGGLGAGFEMAPAETAAGLAALAGGGAALGKYRATRAADGIIKGAGNHNAARLDAEIIQDISKLAKSPNQRGHVLGTKQLNAIENRYVKEVEHALGDLPRTVAKPIRGALQNRHALLPEDIDALRGLGAAGEAAAEAVSKAQRIRTLTQPQPAKGGIVGNAIREGLDRAPAAILTGMSTGIPIPVKMGTTGLGQRLLGRTTREGMASSLLKKTDAADDVLARLGPSGHGEALRKLQESVGQTQAVRAAAKADDAAAKLAKEAAKKQDVLNKAREDAIRRQSQVNIQNAGRASEARAVEIGQAQSEAQRLAEQARAAEQARLQTTQRASRSNIESAQRASASRADEVVQQQSMAERLAAEAQAAERARAQTTAQASRANQQSAQAASASRASEVSQKSALETALENARNATTARQSATNLSNAQAGVASRADEIAQQRAAEQARAGTTASQGALNARKTPQVSPMANADEAAKEAARAATTKAQGARNAQVAKQHVSKVLGERNQKMIEEGVKAIQEGRLVGEMSRNAGGFSASVKHIDADQEAIFKTLQAIAKDNPEYAPEVARMFTPGASTEKLYVLQNMVMDRLGVGRKAVDGALSAVTAGKGNPVSSAVYGMGDDQVAKLLGRTKDTLDQPIASAKAYLTTRASRALETLNQGGKLADEDIALLKAMGFTK